MLYAFVDTLYLKNVISEFMMQSVYQFELRQSCCMLQWTGRKWRLHNVRRRQSGVPGGQEEDW